MILLGYCKFVKYIFGFRVYFFLMFNDFSNHFLVCLSCKSSLSCISHCKKKNILSITSALLYNITPHTHKHTHKSLRKAPGTSLPLQNQLLTGLHWECCASMPDKTNQTAWLSFALQTEIFSGRGKLSRECVVVVVAIVGKWQKFPLHHKIGSISGFGCCWLCGHGDDDFNGKRKLLLDQGEGRGRNFSSVTECNKKFCPVPSPEYLQLSRMGGPIKTPNDSVESHQD